MSDRGYNTFSTRFTEHPDGSVPMGKASQETAPIAPPRIYIMVGIPLVATLDDTAIAPALPSSFFRSSPMSLTDAQDILFLAGCRSDFAPKPDPRAVAEARQTLYQATQPPSAASKSLDDYFTRFDEAVKGKHYEI